MRRALCAAPRAPLRSRQLNSAAAGAGAFTYRGALVRALAPDFAEAALRPAGAEPIDGALARAQHAAYVAALSAALPAGSVMELPAAAGCPDSVFLEDTAVVVGGRALLARPGAPSRRGEPAAVGDALRSLGYAVHTMVAPAMLDGGDVLYTGREVFVGVSARTNALGAEALRAALPGLRVTAVPLAELAAGAARGVRHRLAHTSAAAERAEELSQCTPLHLKSLITAVGKDTLAVAEGALGTAVAHAVQAASGVPRSVRRAGGAVSFVLVKQPACNAVLVNGTLLVRARDEGAAGHAALAAYAADEGLKVVELNMSELAKADGALSCCSILLPELA
jgi:dimethylargininase